MRSSLTTMGVRWVRTSKVLLTAQSLLTHIRGSSNGRTTDSESVYGGSNPSPRATASNAVRTRIKNEEKSFLRFRCGAELAVAQGRGIRIERPERALGEGRQKGARWHAFSGGGRRSQERPSRRRPSDVREVTESLSPSHPAFMSMHGHKLLE